MTRYILPLILAALTCALSAAPARAHCEIPCGIYGDQMRIDMLMENIQTVEKSMRMIRELDRGGESNWNQLVRWVSNKEEHCDKIQEIVTQYFMTQRFPLVDPDKDKAAYDRQTMHLHILHGILVHAMKAKQTTDDEHCFAMREHLMHFAETYFTAEDLEHFREHHAPAQADDKQKSEPKSAR